MKVQNQKFSNIISVGKADTVLIPTPGNPETPSQEEVIKKRAAAMQVAASDGDRNPKRGAQPAGPTSDLSSSLLEEGSAKWPQPHAPRGGCSTIAGQLNPQHSPPFLFLPSLRNGRNESI